MDALKLVSTIGNHSTFRNFGPEIHIEDERVSFNFMSVYTFFFYALAGPLYVKMTS